MDALTFQRAADISPNLASKLIVHVNAALMEFPIPTLAQQAAWIAQAGHESMGFTRTREMWGPTPAQLRYEGRKDLGNVQPGDGKRFMGRGWFQITGRDGYIRASKALGLDLVTHPEMLEDVDLAATSAAWWWNDHGCGVFADKGDFLSLSIRINGKDATGFPNGWEDRQRRWSIAKAAMGVA